MRDMVGCTGGHEEAEEKEGEKKGEELGEVGEESKTLDDRKCEGRRQCKAYRWALKGRRETD